MVKEKCLINNYMLNLFRKEIQQGIKERAKLYIPQLPLTIEQTTTLCDLLKINCLIHIPES